MSGAAIDVGSVSRDIEVTTVARKSLQTFLLTSTSANDLLLVLQWFLSVVARMIVVGCGTDARVVVVLTNQDHMETAVKPVS